MSEEKLLQFFKDHTKVAIAFSGGVDSAYLLYAAKKSGADVTAYYVKSSFQPQFELEDAKRLAEELNGKMRILPLDVLSCEEVAMNPKNRCYYCKRHIFSKILMEAQKDGYTCIVDGTNASDDAQDRPGMKALRELEVRSPLRECGLTKAEIRENSKKAGLFTWDKPAYACLATRIPAGVTIREEDLARVEKAEEILMKMGFSDFRVRLYGEAARIQVKGTQMEKLVLQRNEILEKLKVYYPVVMLDLEER